MRYPTFVEVEVASHEQLCRWYRFLPSPGASAIGTNNVQRVLDGERLVMGRIVERVKELGGFTPEISKELGWEP